MKSRSKRLVIDANTARSAGNYSDAPTSTACRGALKAIRASGHKVVFNKALREEWRCHGSRYAMSWLTAMQQQGRVIEMTSVSFDYLRKAFEQLPPGTRGKNAVLKDIHLVTAALSYDKLLVSNDLKLKVLLYIYSAQHVVLGDLVWALPSEADFIPWILAGAKVRDEWLISEVIIN